MYVRKNVNNNNENNSEWIIIVTERNILNVSVYVCVCIKTSIASLQILNIYDCQTSLLSVTPSLQHPFPVGDITFKESGNLIYIILWG